MPPLLDSLTPRGLVFDIPAWLRWILSRVHITTTDQPRGVVVLDLKAKRYLNVELRLGRGVTVSIDLRD